MTSAGIPARGRLTPPVPGFVNELGGMCVLVGQALGRGVRPPFSWGPEFVAQFRFVVKICFVPLMLSSFALSFGPAGVQAAGFFEAFGALDRMGGAYEFIVLRLFAPLVVGIIIAGAAGTAICADLGARQVREEIDALRVLGVDPVRSLVTPRFLALLAASFLFLIFSVISGTVGALVVVLQHHDPPGPFFSAFFSNANVTELLGSLAKCTIFGAAVAIVSCYKGMNVSGGPEGVGRAVNQSVVVAFLTIGFVDYVFTQLLLANYPVLSEVRG